MDKIRCYLAGSFSSLEGYGDWRDLVIDKLQGHLDFYDPRKDTAQTCIATFVSQDLAGIESCDIVFYFITGVGDVGAVAECAWGLAKGKLIILCVKEGVGVVHPFVIGLCRRMLLGMPVGIAYLQNLADVGLENEFKAIYKTMAES